MVKDGLLKLFGAVLLVTVALQLGFHALVDPDIGWHLAGGLWMLEHAQVPSIDPFGTTGRVWVAYSWLPELCFAYTYRLTGFLGLQILQMFLAVFALLSLALLGLSFLPKNQNEKRFLAISISTLLLLPFLAPILDLRPQLLSFIFSAVALGWILQRRDNLFRYFSLLLIWVNSHVFWVFLPAYFFLWGMFRGRFVFGLSSAILFFLVGAISPYGYRNITAIFDYALSHSAGYRLIEEFQPLDSSLGFIYFYFLVSLIILFFLLARAGRQSWNGSRNAETACLLLLSFTFATAAFLQRKYLPFYGLCLSPLLANKIFSMIRLRVQTKTPVRIFLLSGSLLVGSILVLPNETSLRPEQEEYLRLVAAPEVSGRVFSGFNDGGWLALALELSAKTGKVFSLIDGRTLVMGEERLKEYADFVSEKTKDCDQLRQWQADTVIVRTGSKITNRLEGACRENWRRLKSGQYWNVFQAERPGEFATPQAVRP